MTSAIEQRQIGLTKVRVSSLGVGGGSLFSSIGNDGVREVIDGCWNAGLRYFDTAAFYVGGVSETRFGHGLAGRPRDAFTLSTKVGRYIRDGHEAFDYSAAATEASVAESLRRLQTDRLDIVSIHDVTRSLHGSAFEQRFAEATAGAAPALARLRDQGVIGAIGVAMSDWEVAQRFAETGMFDCVMLAGGYTLLRHESLAGLLPFCASNAMSVIVAAPFNTGILATGAIEGARFSYRPAPPEILERTRALEAVCAAYGVPLAAAALQFSLGHPAVASVVVGHQATSEVRRNIALIEHPIPPEMWAEMCKLGLIPQAVQAAPAR